MANMTQPQTIVVGAGPSGLLLGLMLAKRHINVRIIEAKTELDDSPRAMVYAAPAAYELRRAGVLEDVQRAGYLASKFCWRKLDGTYLGSFDNSLMENDPDRMVCLPLSQLCRLLYEHALQQPTLCLSFGHKVVQTGQDRDKAWVDVESSEGSTRLEASHVVGCDGASSIIRRQLFGDWAFPGMTWEKQLVAANVSYPFEKHDYEDVNYFIHPEHWHMVARLTRNADNSGLWRIAYGETAGLSKEEIHARHSAKFKTMLPGSPEPGEYELVALSPFMVHQRLAEKLRVGRFILAADAAHLCNPFGGLGLTGGLVDVGGVYDCLMGIYSGQADESILDIYSDVRRQKFQSITDPITTANFERLYHDPDTVAQEDDFLKMLVALEHDNGRHLQFLRSLNALKYDFTQHYRGRDSSASPEGGEGRMSFVEPAAGSLLVERAVKAMV